MVTDDREALLFWRKGRRYHNLSSADGGSRRYFLRKHELLLQSQQPQSHPQPQPLRFLRTKWTMIPVMIATNTAITTMLPQFSLSHSIDASSVN